MNLIYLSSSTIPSKAANSVHVMRMCSAFSKYINSVNLFCTKGEHNANDNIFVDYGINEDFAISYIFKPKVRVIGGFIYSIFSKYEIKRHQASFLYGRHLASIFTSRKSGIPFAYEAHQIPINNWQKYMLRSIFKQSNFRGLIVISDALKYKYIKLFPHLKEEKIFVCHDGADPFPENLLQKENNSSNLEKRIKIGYIGSLFKGRGIETIMSLAKFFPKVDFDIIGGSKEQISEYKRNGSPDNLNFIGFLSNSEVIKKYSKYDILLAPYQRQVSVSGGRGDTSEYMSPLKIFEYMSTGKAIVCSDHPVIKEILTHDFSAILCSPDDMDQWKNAILRLISNEKLRSQLGENARIVFLEKFTWQKRAKSIIKLLEIV